jgi:hypothetical protein
VGVGVGEGKSALDVFQTRICPPINLATFLFSILDSKRRLGTFKFSFGLILLILFFFLMALSLTERLIVY